MQTYDMVTTKTGPDCTTKKIENEWLPRAICKHLPRRLHDARTGKREKSQPLGPNHF